MLGPSHWLQEISLPKRVCHYFWPGLMPYLVIYRGCWIGLCVVGRCEEKSVTPNEITGFGGLNFLS